jgi:hypothetical protein
VSGTAQHTNCVTPILVLLWGLWLGVCLFRVCLSVVLAAGSRPVPFRTRKLSLPAPMVLHPGGCGRVGRRRHPSVWGGPGNQFSGCWGLLFFVCVCACVGGVGGVGCPGPAWGEGRACPARPGVGLVFVWGGAAVVVLEGVWGVVAVEVVVVVGERVGEGQCHRG